MSPLLFISGQSLSYRICIKSKLSQSRSSTFLTIPHMFSHKQIPALISAQYIRGVVIHCLCRQTSPWTFSQHLFVAGSININYKMKYHNGVWTISSLFIWPAPELFELWGKLKKTQRHDTDIFGLSVTYTPWGKKVTLNQKIYLYCVYGLFNLLHSSGSGQMRME